MKSLTKQQNEALDRAYAMLSEQFEGVLLAVLSEGHDGEEEVEMTKVLHYGGVTMALGLTEVAKNRLLTIPPKNIEPGV